MADLTGFLLARIAKDETIAQLAGNDAEEFEPESGYQTPVDAHIERWNPARVLAECEAKRRIVNLPEPDADGGFVDGWWEAHHAILCILAQLDADHPDFDPSWRVE